MKNMQATYIENPPRIDGDLSDSIWSNLPIATGFRQTNPNPFRPASQKTEVRIAYDNEAIYVSAKLLERIPDSINNFLTERDDFGNADWFIVVFNTYQDGINGEGFAVTPAGVQIDVKYSIDEESNTWDAVWESATEINAEGWTVEMKIPFSALRFPEKEEQVWGINFGRQIRRKREASWWNFVNPAVDGFLTQTGTLTGIQNIKPPLRLFFFPYASAYVENNSAFPNQYQESFNGGMDVKYGISDAFTLDMTLIPDFGQTRFDNQVLNLTQFEVQFNENRQFFTEGIELFNKSGLFYSRRVGGLPYNFIDDSDLAEKERIVENPQQAQLINATKLSGRAKNGLGVGVFNAVENESYAIIRNDSSGAERKVLTNPMSNYNVIVLDQVLRKNSFLTFTNTNVTREGAFRDANVSQIDAKLANKANTYAISGFGGMSRVSEANSLTEGYTWSLIGEKISGNFTFGLGTEQIESDFDPNDLGFLPIRNIERYLLYGEYAIYEPFSVFNFAKHEVEFIYERLIEPSRFVNYAMSWSTVYSTRNFHAFGLNAGIEPVNTNDYFETRSYQQHYDFPKNYWFGGFISTDYSRPFAFDIRLNRRLFDEPGRSFLYYKIAPRFRPNDKLFFVLNYEWSERLREMGFVNNINDSIYFGRRDVITHVSSINGNYTFNNKMALGLVLRHYWSTALYDRFNLVDAHDGKLLATDYGGFKEDRTTIHDISFNAFNIDLTFTWRFAPGSDIAVVWKNIIQNVGDPLETSYKAGVEELDRLNQTNNFSIKILYFIDYLNLKKKSN